MISNIVDLDLILRRRSEQRGRRDDDDDVVTRRRPGEKIGTAASAGVTNETIEQISNCHIHRKRWVIFSDLHVSS